MSGHSKWAQIKRKKGVTDTKRGQLFTRLARDITIAVREGGSGDPEGNFQLRLAIDKARTSNMPKDNIERAIKRGTGESSEGGQLEDVVYEGYGPGGAAILVQVLTDNRNRAASDVRRVFTRSGGNLAATGAVSWMFERKGVVTIEADGRDAEDIELQLIDLGADDVLVDGNLVEAQLNPHELHRVREELHKRKIPIENAEITMIPKAAAAIDPEHGIQTMKLVEQLEELDDVQKVTTNLDISDDLLSKFETNKEHA